MRRWMTLGSAAALTAALAATEACGGSKEPRPLRQNSSSYSFTIKPDDAPPHARQDIHYIIQVFDTKTRQPIEHGEGQLFAGKPIYDDAPTGPQTKTWDGLTYGPEIGTYHAKLNYVIAGLWGVAIRFRRDSLHPLERIDWMQDVLDERPESTATPAAQKSAAKAP
jgi:hypothetical protein